MRKSKVEEISRKLSVFSFGRLQDLATLLDFLERERISIKEVKEFIHSSLEIREVNQARFKKMAEER